MKSNKIVFKKNFCQLLFFVSQFLQIQKFLNLIFFPASIQTTMLSPLKQYRWINLFIFTGSRKNICLEKFPFSFISVIIPSSFWEVFFVCIFCFVGFTRNMCFALIILSFLLNLFFAKGTHKSSLNVFFCRIYTFSKRLLRIKGKFILRFLEIFTMVAGVRVYQYFNVFYA